MKLIRDFFIAYGTALGAGVLLLGALFLALASLLGDRDEPRLFRLEQSQVNRRVSPEELAGWFVQNRRDFEVLDLRGSDSYKKGHIKNARSCPACHVSKKDAREKFEQGQDLPDFRKILVIYTQDDQGSILLPRILSSNKYLYRLEGGFDAWEREILTKRNFTSEDSARERLLKIKQNALRNYFLGIRETLEVPPVTPQGVKMKRRRHIIRSGPNEGC